MLTTENIRNNSCLLICVLTISLQFSISLSGLSQIETKTITKNRGSYIEQYEVPKKGKKIKHGSYLKFAKLGLQMELKDSIVSMRFETQFVILEYGQFVNGMKEGLWTYNFDSYPWNIKKEQGYYRKDLKHGLWTTFWKDTVETEQDIEKYAKRRKIDSVNVSISKYNERIKSRGVYNNGVPSGAWEYYNYDGKLVQKYNYSDKELLWTNNFTHEDKMNHKLYFIGGSDNFNYYMAENIGKLDFTEKPKSDSLTLKITIDSDGNIADIKELTKNDHFSNIDKKIINTLKGSNGLWIPKKLEDNNISSSFILITTIEIERNQNSVIYSQILKIKTEDN